VRFVREFNGKTVEGYHLIRCLGCGMVVYENSAPFEVDYSDYGVYLEKSPEEMARYVDAVSLSNQKTFQRLVAAYGGGAKVLDFGSGAGYFAAAATRAGLDAYGIEISERLIDISVNQLGFKQVSADLASLPSRFDAIFMNDVIEHLEPKECRALMTSLLDKLSSGGVLIGNTPNYGSLNILLAGGRDPAIWPPYHRCYFSSGSMDCYFKSLGLEKVVLKTCAFSTNGFFRPSKNEPSFVELSMKQAMPLGRKLLALGIRSAFKVIGALAGPAGLGYQLYFEYRKL
jgi:SAM-dependent methyltransferase